MASIYNLKPQFQYLLRPAIQRLAQAGVTPNAITISAMAGSFCAGLALWLGCGESIWLLLIPAWLFARMALNALDGMLARECNMATPQGMALNEVGDVLSDIALYLPLAVWNAEASVPAVAFTLGAMLTEFCGLLGCALGAGRRYEGPMGKSDRAVLIGGLCLVTWFSPGVLSGWKWIFAIATLLTVMTCRNRIVTAIRKTQNRSY
jgi:phosphatidylglycerophosphate synthase